MIQFTPTGEKIYLFMLGEKIDTVICEILIVTLENNGHNRVHTARALGVSVRTIRNWIKKYQLGEEDCVEDPST